MKNNETIFILNKKIGTLTTLNKVLLNENDKLRKFAMNIRDNYDCDKDGHKYNTYCRSCEAKSLLENF